MHAVRLEAVIPRSRKLAITLPAEVPIGDVDLIIVSKQKAQQSNTQALLQYLRQRRLTSKHRRSADEIDAYIEQERLAWD